jgi:hypothetical protein
MSSSAAVQQLPCARSHSFLDHESSSISFTTTWRRGKSTKRRSSLLRVCVHPQLHLTYQQLFQYTALLPRVHGIETEATLRVHDNCKLSCVVAFSGSVYCTSWFVCWKMLTLMSSEASRKIGHILFKTHYLIVASM